MLSLLILGPHQPGKNIDVYLSPLVDGLKTLWEKGVETYDAHLHKVFTLKAILYGQSMISLHMETWSIALWKDIMHVQYVEKEHILKD